MKAEKPEVILNFFNGGSELNLLPADIYNSYAKNNNGV
jgi:hypothetical protein